MISINLICMGRLKEQYLRDACAEYIKRLGAFCRIQVTELSPKQLPENPSQAIIQNALEAEGRAILSKISAGSRIYSLCIEGKQLSSEELSHDIENSVGIGTGNLVFIIGSSFGLSCEVKNRSDLKLSMSKMTFPHQLARLMLLEQVYRAFQISVGGKYHK